MRYSYDADCGHVVDGDTYDVICDLGFKIGHEVRVRLIGIDTAEIYGPNASDAGKKQANFVRAWFTDAAANYEGGDPLIVHTEKDDTGKYGRYLAHIERKSDGQYLAEALLDEFGDEVRYS